MSEQRLDQELECPACGEPQGETVADCTIQGWNAGAQSEPEECHSCGAFWVTRLLGPDGALAASVETVQEGEL